MKLRMKLRMNRSHFVPILPPTKFFIYFAISP
nr:MAG TPA: hypothetical protein [Caudoviricetes sp.]